jgi:hypothetical protein
MQQNSSDALFCENCGVALTPPVPPPANRKPWPRTLFIAGGTCVLMAVLAAVVVLFWPRPDPRESVEQIRVALLHHDLPAFEQHVELDRLLTDAIVQAASFAASEGVVTEFDAGPGTAALAGSTAAALASAAAPQLIPELARLSRQLVSAGTWTAQGMAASPGDPSPVLMQFMSEALSSQLSYRGAEVLSRQGPAAQVAVSVATPLQVQPLTIRLRMEIAEGRWRVVGIDDLAGLIRQVEALGNTLGS